MGIRIHVAKTAGFCMGVRRAMDIVLARVNRTTDHVVTLGPLIHNPSVVSLLDAKGVKVATSPEECHGAVAVVRAHGIPPTEEEKLRACASEVLDATCPHVQRVQKLARRAAEEGRMLIVVGDPDHPEVLGIIGHAKRNAYVVQSLEDVAALPHADNVTVVAQTTQNRERYKGICNAVRERFPTATIHDTICDSTSNRQKEVRELCEFVDALVVVGGRNSANTKRLAMIGEEKGVRTYHVESADELQAEWFKDCTDVGVTAGASTPSWQISQVVDRLGSFANSPGERIISRILEAVIYGHLYIALGAAGLTLAVQQLVGVDAPWLCCMVAALVIFVAHTINHLTDPSADRINHPLKADFYSRHRRPLTWAAFGAAALTLLLSLQISWSAVALSAISIGAGMLYRLPLIKRQSSARGLNGRQLRLAHVPASKELLLAGGWTAMTALMPLANASPKPSLSSVAIACTFVFVITFAWSTLLDLRGIGADRILGRETIATQLGKRKTQLLVRGLLAATALLLLAGLWLGATKDFTWFCMIVIALFAADLSAMSEESHSRQTMRCEASATTNLVLLGVFAIAQRIIQ